MPELPLERLEIQPRHLALVHQLLHRHLPHAEIWAFGSRVNGNSHETSDLDLVVRQPPDPKQETAHLREMRDALVESNLPIRVDLVDWARIPLEFQQEIERAYVVLQREGMSEFPT